MSLRFYAILSLFQSVYVNRVTKTSGDVRVFVPCLIRYTIDESFINN